jgi:hypothetical protein
MLHFFGRLGLLGTVLGGLILGWLGVDKLTGHQLATQHEPLMVAGALSLMAGMLLFSTGLLSEVLIRIYFEARVGGCN